MAGHAFLVLPRRLLDEGGDEARAMAEEMVIQQAGYPDDTPVWSDLPEWPSLIAVEVGARG